MSFKDIVIGLIFAVVIFNDRCPTYTCKLLDNDDCVYYDGRDYLINSHLCPPHKNCDLRDKNESVPCH